MGLMKVIGIVGMPGSGKSDAADVARSMGIPVVVMGDIIRQEVAGSGQAIGPETLRSMMVCLREKHGKNVVAERCIPLIRSFRSRKIVVVDGLRSLDEVKVFRREFPNMNVIAVHSSPKTRYDRLKERRRTDDPDTWKDSYNRDRLELDIGIGEVIALADVVVSNEGSQSEFRENMRRTLLKVAADD